MWDVSYPFSFLAANLRMRRNIFVGVFILFFLLGDVGGVICRLCNLSIPFHGCLFDFGTCRAMPNQYCITETHIKYGIRWYMVKGCTVKISECFEKIDSAHDAQVTHCCRESLCNF